MIHRLRIIRSIIRANIQQEMAYFANRVLISFSPLFYSLTLVLLIEVMFQSITTLAGYSRNEMLLVVFFGQAMFYGYSFWGEESAFSLEEKVNNGGLDYDLVRPVSSLFWVTVARIHPVRGLINFTGPLLPLVLLIDWPALGLDLSLIPIAFMMLVISSVLYHQIQFMFASIVFWTGRAKQAMYVVYTANSQSIPLEGFSARMQVFFLGILPVYMSAAAASVLLGRASVAFWVPASIVILVVFSSLKRLTWERALARYSSASS